MNLEELNKQPLDPNDVYLYCLRKMADENVQKNRSNLTDLLNLKDFLFKSDDLIRFNDEKYAIIVMDIAGFKLVNEFCSRKEGDYLLRHIADCFRTYENAKTAVAHFRADVFALCTPYEQEEDLIEIVEVLSDQIKSFPISCKILPAFGICIVPDKKATASDVQDHAFIAQKTIKGKYFTNYAFFDQSMHDKMLLEKQIENTFDEALATDQFQLYVQPKVDMVTGEVIGGEALARWVHPETGMISPGAFIPVLEKNASIIDMDKYIWEKVFILQSELINTYGIRLPISINISRMHAYDHNLAETLQQLSLKYQVDPVLVPLELTESAYSESEELMYEKIKALKSYGFVFSMDDFGSGYSTMNMLVSQPVDEVKIDRGFLFHIGNPKSQALVRHTISMLHDLDLPIVAEGVENNEQKELLTKWGCRYAQGFLFHKPMPSESYKALLIK